MASRVRGVYETILFGYDNAATRLDTSAESDGHSSIVDSPTSKQIEAATAFRGSIATLQSTLSRSSTLQAISHGIDRTLHRAPGDAASWRPTFFQLRPLIGLFGLVISLCCVFGALIVLMLSDGEPTDSWPLAPTVYLAIMTALGNRYAWTSRPVGPKA